MKAHDIEQGSEAWHAIRAGKVTGTRFKDLVSGETTTGFKNLIAALASEIITGEKEDQGFTNAAMQRGIDLEPDARELYERTFECEVKEVGFITPDEDHEYYGWLGISPDGITNGGVEIKCPLQTTHLKYIKANRMPSEYRWQIQGSLYVTGLPFWDFISYYPNMKPFIIRVLPCKEDHDKIEERLRIVKKLVEKAMETYYKYDHLREPAAE